MVDWLTSGWYNSAVLMNGQKSRKRGTPRIAVVSGLSAAAPPAAAALAEVFPEAEVWNVIDDRLIEECTRAGSITPELEARMRRLLAHAALSGADGILITCSLFAYLADDVATELDLPVLGPDDAAFEAGLEASRSVLHVVSGVPLALADSTGRLDALARSRGSSVRIAPVLSTAAREASLLDDDDATAARMAEALSTVDDEIEAVVLANFSLSPAAVKLSELIGRPVITGPRSAAAALRAAICN